MNNTKVINLATVKLENIEKVINQKRLGLFTRINSLQQDYNQSEIFVFLTDYLVALCSNHNQTDLDHDEVLSLMQLLYDHCLDNIIVNTYNNIFLVH